MEKWTAFNQSKLGMMDAVMLLDNIVDESDPDVSALQIQMQVRRVHAKSSGYCAMQECVV